MSFDKKAFISTLSTDHQVSNFPLKRQLLVYSPFIPSHQLILSWVEFFFFPCWSFNRPVRAPSVTSACRDLRCGLAQRSFETLCPKWQTVGSSLRWGCDARTHARCLLSAACEKQIIYTALKDQVVGWLQLDRKRAARDEKWVSVNARKRCRELNVMQSLYNQVRRALANGESVQSSTRENSWDEKEKHMLSFYIGCEWWV